MGKTLSKEVDEIIGIGKRAIMRGWMTPERACESVGLLIFRAQGEGFAHDGEPITRRGQMTLTVRMSQMATEALRKIDPNSPKFPERRKRIAEVLGDALLG